eukprot:140475-Prorocentrum_minimum.AAC.1
MVGGGEFVVGGGGFVYLGYPHSCPSPPVACAFVIVGAPAPHLQTIPDQSQPLDRNIPRRRTSRTRDEMKQRCHSLDQRPSYNKLS